MGGEVGGVVSMLAQRTASEENKGSQPEIKEHVCSGHRHF
ncbi:MAG: hypothetical protein OJF52_004525 [Nitrospira sp.]|nr:MAG: hypothetical protein OJF52_004525 [Nitrospira sp.]